jgi:hypothetical protein
MLFTYAAHKLKEKKTFISQQFVALALFASSRRWCEFRAPVLPAVLSQNNIWDPSN